MVTSNKKTARSKAGAAFTLVEVTMALGILVLAMSGMIYGYTQTNYQAEWSSMSLAVQALTVQSIEQARAAKWDIYSSASGSNPDELPPGTTNIIYTGAVLIPSSGQTMSVTNILKITTITTIPAVRQIRSDCAWYFPRTGIWFTNTVITYRGGN
jgi:type II secretory pathway pseudopilin PulG